MSVLEVVRSTEREIFEPVTTKWFWASVVALTAAALIADETDSLQRAKNNPSELPAAESVTVPLPNLDSSSIEAPQRK